MHSSTSKILLIELTRTIVYVSIVSTILYPIAVQASTLKRSPYAHIEQVALVEVLDILPEEFLLHVSFGTSTKRYVTYDDSTRFYTGTDNEVNQWYIKKGQMVYLFMVSNRETSSSSVEKIIIKNKSRLTRKSSAQKSPSLLSRFFDDATSTPDSDLYTQESIPEQLMSYFRY